MKKSFKNKDNNTPKRKGWRKNELIIPTKNDKIL